LLVGIIRLFDIAILYPVVKIAQPQVGDPVPKSETIDIRLSQVSHKYNAFHHTDESIIEQSLSIHS